MASLIIQRAGQPDRERELGELALTIGRGPDCELVIDDRSVSRHHARIEPAGDGHAIRDLESRNGTWVRGERVGTSPVPLTHGDEIGLGRHSVVVRYLTEEQTVPEGMGPLQSLVTHVPGASAAWEEGGRAFRILRMTPWLRFTSAAVGLAAGTLALLWWISKWT